jgi:hypothetical protein
MKASLNDIVRNNTLSPARVANALDAGKVFVATGTDTYEVTVGLGITGYVLGDSYRVQIPNPNTVTTPTINVTGASALGAKTITDNEGNALAANDLKDNGIYDLVYDGTNFRVINIGGGGGTIVIGIQDLYFPASGMWPRTTGGCAALARTEMATSLLNIQTLDFDQTTQEFAQFTMVAPRKWDGGTLTVVFYWTASSGSGDVQWGISGGAYSNDDALTVAFGSAVTVDDTLITTNDQHTTSATAALTLAGTPADADFLAFQISRNVASDTLSGDAKLQGISIRFTTNAGVDA